MGGREFHQHRLCRNKRLDPRDHGRLSDALEQRAEWRDAAPWHGAHGGDRSDRRAGPAPAYAHWLESFTFLSRTYNLPAPPMLPSSFEQALDRGFCVAGSSATVREELAKQVTEAGVTYVMCHLAFGDMALADSLQTISSMRAIMPSFASPAILDEAAV